MTVEVTKLVTYGVIGPVQGVSISKVVAYVVLVPGVESGVTPPVHHSFTYGQRKNADE